MARPLSTVLIISLVCIASRVPAAQTRPNLAGSWKLVPQPESGAVEGGGNRAAGGLGIGIVPFSLTNWQDATTLTVQEHYSHAPAVVKVLYQFDGQPVRNRFRMPVDTAPSEVTSRWQDNRLVSSVVVRVPGDTRPRRYQQTLSLDPEGSLVVRIEDARSNARRVIYQR